MVSDCVDIPTGYDWVYVVKADGTISNGFKYTMAQSAATKR